MKEHGFHMIKFHHSSTGKAFVTENDSWGPQSLETQNTKKIHHYTEYEDLGIYSAWCVKITKGNTDRSSPHMIRNQWQGTQRILHQQIGQHLMSMGKLVFEKFKVPHETLYHILVGIFDNKGYVKIKSIWNCESITMKTALPLCPPADVAHWLQLHAKAKSRLLGCSEHFIWQSGFQLFIS